MVNYQNKKIVIVGLGLTGISCINFFMARGVIPRVMDTRILPPGYKKLPEQVKCHLGSLKYSWLITADLIVLSPGISITHPSLNEANRFGVEIVNDIELFCREVHDTPVIAITGSNGKSTVTSMVGEIVKIAGMNVGIGGNIGIPVLMLLNSIYDIYVLELSSFQLETTYSLQTIAATILNISEDHMDRYPLGIQQYSAIKLRIYKNAKVCVVNADDSLTMPLYSRNKYCVSFGINIGDYHLTTKYGETWLCMQDENLLNVKDMLLLGQHNYINALAAIALADAANLPRASTLQVLTTFSGLSHRFQLVLERNNIRWINDSKATNVGSTKAALKGLHIKGTLHLLLGGNGKSNDFSPLKSWLINNKVRIYCFGHDKDRLAALCPEITEQTETLEQAMYKISLHVRPGDIVLLSPACSSFDQFENFEHRGSLFTHLAKKLG